MRAAFLSLPRPPGCPYCAGRARWRRPVCLIGGSAWGMNMAGGKCINMRCAGGSGSVRRRVSAAFCSLSEPFAQLFDSQRVATGVILVCEKACFAIPNGPSCRPKWPILENRSARPASGGAKNGASGGVLRAAGAGRANAYLCVSAVRAGCGGGLVAASAAAGWRRTKKYGRPLHRERPSDIYIIRISYLVISAPRRALPCARRARACRWCSRPPGLR